MKRFAIASLLLLSGCPTRLNTLADFDMAPRAPDLRGGGSGDGSAGGALSFVSGTDLDILFVIDDSASMGPKQAELRNRFSELAQVIEDNDITAGRYHIGVITTNLGAGPFTIPTCSPGGRGGRLQQRGAAATPGCLGPTGLNYIDLDVLNGSSSNLPSGQSLTTTFNCMAQVGDTGCGFEQPLEALYRALHDQPAENTGFLRPGARLLIVLVTDEDDCSIDPTSDLFDASKTAQYGPLLSYRCTRFGLICDSGAPPSTVTSPTTLNNCRASSSTDGGKLIGVDKYIKWLTAPLSSGGLKADPNDVMVVSLTGPSQPVQVLRANPTSPTYSQCSVPGCEMVLQHTCTSGFIADPAVRLNGVLATLGRKATRSVCDTSYSAAMSAAITSLPGTQCFTPSGEKPSCQVTFDDEPADICGSAPCYTLAVSPECQNAGFGTHQLRVRAPDRTKVNVSCN